MFIHLKKWDQGGKESGPTIFTSNEPRWLLTEQWICREARSESNCQVPKQIHPRLILHNSRQHGGHGGDLTHGKGGYVGNGHWNSWCVDVPEKALHNSSIFRLVSAVMAQALILPRAKKNYSIALCQNLCTTHLPSPCTLWLRLSILQHSAWKGLTIFSLELASREQEEEEEETEGGLCVMGL